MAYHDQFVEITDLQGATLRSVRRLAWTVDDRRPELIAGPVLLVVTDSDAVVVDARGDWTLGWRWTHPDAWTDSYAYEADDARWVERDASAEEPFDRFVGRVIDTVDFDWNDLHEVTGVRLRCGEDELRLAHRAGSLVVRP